MTIESPERSATVRRRAARPSYDRAHDDAEAGCAVNRWLRAQMRRWREGDRTASPLYWAALITFAVDGAR